MRAGSGAGRRAFATVLATLALTVAGATAASAQAAPGGIGTTSTKRVETPPVQATPTAPAPAPPAVSGSKLAALVAGKAIPPTAAPPAVIDVIEAANRIRTKPYVWGGGHGSWGSRGYDCSGAVSYALHGGGLLSSPLVSGSFARWGAPGPGRWITIYANGQHVYAVIAGLRWDTSGNVSGTGPRWHRSPPYPRGFAVRHPVGY